MRESPTLLITGGTGTLGRALVERYAADPVRIVVLARDPARAQALWPSSSVAVVRGDITAGDHLGLDPSDGLMLRDSVTAILHSAAETRFTRPLDAARAVNVEGTRAVLEFAARCPSLDRIGIASTVYVAGQRCGTILEDDLGDRDTGFVNSYEQSKCEMEMLAREAMARLPIAVYRLSTIIGDARSGVVRGYNTVHHALRLLYQGLAPMIPGSPSTRVDLIGSDFAADAIRRLFSCAFEAGQTCHLCAGEAGAPLDQVLAATMDAFRRSRPGWRKRTIEPPAVVDLATYELFVRSLEEAGQTMLHQAATAVRSFAHQLAHPKTFDTRHADVALAPSGIAPAPLLDFYPRVVQHCVETGWGTMTP